MIEITKFIEGLIIGVGVGITTSVVLSAYHFYSKLLRRREQILFVRRFVASHMNLILNVEDLPPPETGKSKIPADQVRYVFLRQFQDDFRSIVSYRTTELSYKEIWSLQKILLGIQRSLTDLPLAERKIFPRPIAVAFYEELGKIDWLRMSKSTQAGLGK